VACIGPCILYLIESESPFVFSVPVAKQTYILRKSFDTFELSKSVQNSVIEILKTRLQKQNHFPIWHQFVAT